MGAKPDALLLDAMVERMAGLLFEVISKPVLGADASALLRLDPLRNERKPEAITFSGGVSEYIYARESEGFGDLGPALARAILARIEAWGPRIEPSDEGIRATVIGASQYTIQVSGSTIFVAPHSVLPLRNVPVVTPDLPLEDERLAVERISGSVRAALRRLDLDDGERAVALCLPVGRASATFCAAGGLLPGNRGRPCECPGTGPAADPGRRRRRRRTDRNPLREETRLPNPIVSIDGIALKEFDFIDIGALLETSGAVPVVIKSLVFPGSAAVGRVK